MGSKIDDVLFDLRDAIAQRQGESAQQIGRLQSALHEAQRRLERTDARLAATVQQNDKLVGDLNAARREAAHLRTALERTDIRDRAARSHLEDLVATLDGEIAADGNWNPPLSDAAWGARERARSFLAEVRREMSDRGRTEGEK